MAKSEGIFEIYLWMLKEATYWAVKSGGFFEVRKACLLVSARGVKKDKETVYL